MEQFSDGILKIISGYGDDIKIKEIYLNMEYDEPITLDEIATSFPDVRMVIFETALQGYIFTYGNHVKGQWENVGTTYGYA